MMHLQKCVFHYKLCSYDFHYVCSHCNTQSLIIVDKSTFLQKKVAPVIMGIHVYNSRDYIEFLPYKSLTVSCCTSEKKLNSVYFLRTQISFIKETKGDVKNQP